MKKFAVLFVLLVILAPMQTFSQKFGVDLIPEFKFPPGTQASPEYCLLADDNQQFPLQVCYTVSKPYDEAFVRIVFLKGTPTIQGLKFEDRNREISRVIKLSGNAVSRTKNSLSPLLLTDIFRSKTLVLAKEMKMLVTATSISGGKSQVEFTIPLAR